MTYANVVFSYGAERFCSACRETGIDGLILPDLPFEEKEEFLPVCRQMCIRDSNSTNRSNNADSYLFLF